VSEVGDAWRRGGFLRRGEGEGEGEGEGGREGGGMVGIGGLL
jgi:hypothetical protein